MNSPYFDLSDKLLRDLAGKITIIDQNLIKNWKIKDFMDDEDGIVKNKNDHPKSAFA
ncbi:hypothetical protein AGMMS49960_12490 [Betaproteobacteria bacterium]|nr:hypothetical protein AGMMS49960_12490 [Betaproteobacteria bacterium]